MSKKAGAFSFLRAGITLFSICILAVILRTAVSSQISSRLLEFDSRAEWTSVLWSRDAVCILNLQMPAYGLQADSVWVLLEGDLIHPRPSHVVISGGVLDLSESSRGSSGSGNSPSVPFICLQDAELSDGSQIFACRRGAEDVLWTRGTWGEITAHGYGNSFSAVFSELSRLPVLDRDLPGFVNGHSISGMCSGTRGDGIALSGELTGFDGGSASAVFSYVNSHDAEEASLAMDFSQVGGPAMQLLDSLTCGGVMTAVPSGSLHVSMQDSDSLFFLTDLHFDSISVFSQALAPDTFSTEASLFCSGFILPGRNELSVDSGWVALNSAVVFFDLECSWGERRRLSIDLGNPSLTGEDITASIPPELLGRLRGLSLHGELEFATEILLDWDYPDSSDFHIDIDASRLMVGYSPVSFSALREPDGGAVCTMRDSWGNTRTIALDTLNNRSFVLHDSIPPFFEPLLCCAEDGSFRRHHGFSEYHIRNSIRADMVEGRFVRGGSTLSMQLAKNLFLGREKTLARKLQEVFLTWRMERWLTKDRIIELYANIVELGPDVFGFNEAAHYYFNSSFSDLSVRETAFLVSILPGPRLYHRFGENGRLPEYWKSYVERLISICGNRGWLDRDIVSQALDDSLVFSGPVLRNGVDN